LSLLSRFNCGIVSRINNADKDIMYKETQNAFNNVKLDDDNQLIEDTPYLFIKAKIY